MLSRDGVTGLVFLALSLFLLALTRGLPESTMVPVGAGFYPRIVLGIMAVLSAIMLVRDLRARGGARAPAAAPAQGAGLNYRLVAITFGLFGFYVALLPGLGFRIATFLFVLVLQPVLDPPPGWRRWALVFVVALATALFTHLVFEHYLSVLLPRGSWTGV
ncbi:MAG: tripartite tricarboxylate transporter TctB family protein [Proteobacteria bacterium]|nr:tripartite tricarboxylate transporter TctB family protein [Pseudomonadota bacterium]